MEQTLTKPEIREMIREILARLGENPDRPGLKKTPARYERALQFLTKGYTQNVDEIFNGALFESDCDEMIVVRDVEFFSLCEHHLLPFYGRCHVAYLPKSRIVGLSKIPRIVDMFARRLQVQETLTTDIARTLNEKLQPKGIGVVIEAFHLCMMMRGVEKQHSFAVTSAMLGRFKSDPRTRQEFLELVREHMRP